MGAGGEGAEDYACDIMTSKTHATVDTKVVIATAGLVVKNEWERDRERKREYVPNSRIRLKLLVLMKILFLVLVVGDGQ